MVYLARKHLMSDHSPLGDVETVIIKAIKKNLLDKEKYGCHTVYSLDSTASLHTN